MPPADGWSSPQDSVCHTRSRGNVLAPLATAGRHFRCACPKRVSWIWSRSRTLHNLECVHESARRDEGDLRIGAHPEQGELVRLDFSRGMC
jgi:hypothetical protein